MWRAAALVVLAALLGGCGSEAESLTIQLEEGNSSGISGELELRRAGDHSTRLTVQNLQGGRITGAPAMPLECQLDSPLRALVLQLASYTRGADAVLLPTLRAGVIHDARATFAFARGWSP